MSDTVEEGLAKIAKGLQPEWEETYEHPVWGSLTFKATLPTARQLARQAVEMDNILSELDAVPRVGTQILAASIAGVGSLMELPVIRERREVDPDNSHTRIVMDTYNPGEEMDEVFLSTVWTDFSLWRQGFIDGKERVGNSSGETPGSDSSESSTGPMVSPSTTPA